MNPKMTLTGVSKKYTLYRNNTEKLKAMFFPNTRDQHRDFYALKDINLEVYEGETIGVIGINGSGKSTISNILASVIPPTEGEMKVNGETSLIAINVGLNKNLNGYENIEQKCLMHGFSKKEIEELMPAIEEFADIGDFIDQPVKNYSSGMKSRLGFAISAHTNPDILIVDEALSVGDKTFYQKCKDKIDEFKAQNKTIVFISHNIKEIKNLSDRVLWLHNGEVREFGDKNEIIKQYEDYINWFNKLSKEEKEAHKQELKEMRSLAPGKIDASDGTPPIVQPKRDKQAVKRAVWFFGQLVVYAVIFLTAAYFLVVPQLKDALGSNEELENGHAAEVHAGSSVGEIDGSDISL
ncbi:teichoic acids export ABC transporter ATP-binding subunit TagH [Shouchella tritolerans]|uniref:teichoic acids export ABC transporter ATP-binding subunit TagH n=1 Tax=Shouchella tritolerans TaxID=2979466 RepID=UPI0021E927A2|nr:teichoic acids export ABC transporter ATP-binding subunit TagH [Shouchella tritolerans]